MEPSEGARDTQAGETQVADVGLVGRMIRVFYAPAETFEAVQARTTHLDWIVPVLVAAAIAAGSTYMTLPIMEKMQARAVAEMSVGKDMSAEQVAQQKQMMQSMSGVTNVVSIVMVPVMIFVMLFIFAGILLLLGRFLLGGDISYRQMLALQGYSMLISVPHTIILTPIRQARDSLAVTLGPGLLLGPDVASTYLGRLINSIDIFQVWQVAVLGIGLAVLTQASTGKAMGLLFAILALFLAGSAAMSGMIPGM